MNIKKDAGGARYVEVDQVRVGRTGQQKITKARLYIHQPWQCQDGFPCPIHRPSGHHMRHTNLMIAVGLDSQMLLRKCQHNNLHYDPDSLAWWERTYPDTPANAFHRLPYDQNGSMLKGHTPACLRGACCWCCGPTQKRKADAYSTAMIERRTAYGEFLVEQKRIKEELIRAEQERMMRESRFFPTSYTNGSFATTTTTGATWTYRNPPTNVGNPTWP